MNILINNLKDSKLFFNINNLDIENLLLNISYKTLNLTKNQYAFDSFTSANYVGIVLNGNLNVERLLPCGKSILMYTKKKGDMFGEVATFSDSVNYPCNVLSLSKSNLILFYKSDFFKMLTMNETLLNNFLTLVCNKAFSLNKRVGLLSFPSAKSKIAHYLLNNFNINNSLTIKLPFSKQEWANQLNISRASLYRELDELSNNSIITFSKSNTINITNIEKLKSLTLN